MRSFLYCNRWALLAGTAILILTLVPGDSYAEFPGFFKRYHLDKVLHLLMFGSYAGLQARALRVQTVYTALQRHAGLIALIISFILGVGTEALQQFCIPFRTGSLVDLAANVAGILGGLWIVKNPLKTG